MKLDAKKSRFNLEMRTLSEQFSSLMSQMLHAYNSGQVVIHAVGPKLRDLLKGVQGLSRTYLNVPSEYCQADGGTLWNFGGDGNGKMMENDVLVGGDWNMNGL